jgi:hypothetical protein
LNSFFSLSTLFEVVFARGPLRGHFFVREFHMKTRSMVRALMLALALGAAAPGFAVPLMDMRADDLLAMAPDFRKSLNLTPNQQTLWQQVESRSHAILRERQSRRERLQREAATLLAQPAVELRELNARIDAEAGLAGVEDKQLRELWLTMNDALDDRQRQLAAAFVAEQMQRVARENAATPREGREGRGEGRGEGGGRHGGGRRGGAMGMPGA